MMNDKYTFWFGFTPCPCTIMASNVCAVTGTCETMVHVVASIHLYAVYCAVGGAGQTCACIPNSKSSRVRPPHGQFVPTQDSPF